MHTGQGTPRVALWARVSTREQDTQNQALALRAHAQRQGWEIVHEYTLPGTSARIGAHEHKQALEQALSDARSGTYDVLLVWALDRLTRQGIRALLGLIERFDQAGVRIVSLREPWLDTLGQTRDLVLAVLAWVAQMESDRHAERVRAGLDKRRAAGLPVGRQPGAVDKAPRKRSGYVKRWEATRER